MYLRRNVLLVVFSVLLVQGCAEQSVRFTQSPPKVPKPPVVLFNTVEDAKLAVNTPVTAFDPRWPGAQLERGKKIAILPISGPRTSGELLTAIVTLELTHSGVKLVERQVTTALFDEYKMYDFFSPKMKKEKLKDLKKVWPADYFLVAAVTTLDTQVITVRLPKKKFESGDRIRYKSDYDRWYKDALAYLDALDTAANIFDQDPKFQRTDWRSAWVFRNSIAKVRRDVVATGSVGLQKLGQPQSRPQLVYPDFFNRKERKEWAKEVQELTPKDIEEVYKTVSPYGPYNAGGYRPLLQHLAEELPNSPERIFFEWQQGPKSVFQVRSTSVSVAYRLIDPSKMTYVGMGVFEVDDNSEARALRRLAKKLADVITNKLGDQAKAKQ